MLCQGAVVVLPLSRDFFANPGRQIDVLVFMAQFDFGDDQAQVLARKDIDVPSQIAVRNVVAYLLAGAP